MPPGNHCILDPRGGAWEQGYIYIVSKTDITESSIGTLGPPPSTSVRDQGEMNEKCYTVCDIESECNQRRIFIMKALA